MLPLSKSFIIHGCVVTEMEEILMFTRLAVFIRVLSAVFVLFHFPFCFSPFYPLCSQPPPCHYPDPETLNWLFIDASCNWLLITVLHHVLIFKSAVSAWGREPLQCLAVIQCCWCTRPLPKAQLSRLIDGWSRNIWAVGSFLQQFGDVNTFCLRWIKLNLSLLVTHSLW